MSKLKANDVLLQANLGTVLLPDWRDVACLTDNGIDSASDEIDASSKCGVENIPGDVSWTASIGGFYELDPTSTQLSGQKLIEMRQNKTYVNWRMRNAANTYYRGFYAYLSGYSEDLPYNDMVKFTGDLSIQGALITTAPTT
jgi:hypothetical protein